ncbi:MAG: hypothetical protein U0169_11290 [Polyangiaceae bacterium]
MIYEVRIVGDLSLPAGAADELRAHPLDATLFPDWPESLAPTPESAATLEGVAAGRWIDDCERFRPSGVRSFLDVVLGDGRLEAVGLLADTEFEECKRPLATLFRVAGRLGATGTLVFWRLHGGALDFGYRVDVRGGSSVIDRVEGIARLPAFPDRRRPRAPFGTAPIVDDSESVPDSRASGVFPTAPLPHA